MIHATFSGDIFLKSRRTQARMVRVVTGNLADALGAIGHSGRSRRIGGHRIEIDPEGIDAALVLHTTATVFGIGWVGEVVTLPADDLDALVVAAARVAGPTVAGKTFAVRPRRSGDHAWRSQDLAVALGDALRQHGGRVDLSRPEVTVSITIDGSQAHLVTSEASGAGGLPLGTQERVLALVSGGFDSAVAAWMLMSRGAAVDIVHFTLDCAQSDHAVAVAHELWSRWGHGSDPTVHLVEFQPVKDALFAQVDPRMRQVTLKVLMARGAAAIAVEERIPALATGDALGQVSSQTLVHLAAVSRAVDVPILRPLVGLPKETIIDFARRVGTAEISARAREVCDLAEGHPVATAARRSQITRSIENVSDVLMEDAITTRKSFRLADWLPGMTTSRFTRPDPGH